MDPTLRPLRPFAALILGMTVLLCSSAAASPAWLVTFNDPHGLLRNLDTGPFGRQVILLAGHDSANGGLYSINPASVASGARSLDEINRGIVRHVLPVVPEGYEGLVIVDHESWYPDPDRGFNHRYDARTLQALRNMDRNTYQEHAVAILTRWLEVFRQHRPGVRVGFYGLPMMVYRNADTQGQVSYAPGVAEASRRSNDMAQAVIDLQTAVICVAYSPFAATFDNPRVREAQEDRFEHIRAFGRNMLAEGQRLARNGQPVYLLISFRYVRATSDTHADQFLHPSTLLALKSGAIDAQAKGLVLWGSTAMGNTTRAQHEAAADAISTWFRLTCRPIFEVPPEHAPD